MRYMRTKAGTAHVVGATICSVVRRAERTGEWKGVRSLKPEQVLESKDCSKCDSHRNAKVEIGDKSPKAKKPTPVKVDDKGERLAKEHAAFAEEHGWDTTIEHEGSSGRWIVTATKGDEKVTIAWVNGRSDIKRIMAYFPTHEFWLHHTTKWRRQVSEPEGTRPASREAKPKRASRPKANPVASAIEPTEEVVETNGTELPLDEYNVSARPFSMDADELEIRDAIKGRKLFWRNNLAVRINSATVTSNTRLIRLGEAKKTGRRYVSFPESLGWDAKEAREVLGAERSVALEDMIRVR